MRNEGKRGKKQILYVQMHIVCIKADMNVLNFHPSIFCCLSGDLVTMEGESMSL